MKPLGWMLGTEDPGPGDTPDVMAGGGDNGRCSGHQGQTAHVSPPPPGPG